MQCFVLILPQILRCICISYLFTYLLPGIAIFHYKDADVDSDLDLQARKGKTAADDQQTVEVSCDVGFSLLLTKASLFFWSCLIFQYLFY